MSYELCYTSVPQGLRVGTSGFCTVGLTHGTPGPLIERLESLSGYRPLFPAGSPQAAQNPVSWAHWRVSVGGRSYSVLSRVCFAGLDDTQRSNKFAHHVSLTASEQQPGGPAWALLHGNIMRTAWTGEPAEFNREPRLPAGDRPAAPCAAWAAACGDAGWAGVLADAFINAPAKPVYLIYPPQMAMLPLVCEALALVPPQQRWQVTFNTYHTDLPSGLSCAWRCCVAGSPAVDEARGSGAMVIDLSARLPPAPDGPSVRLARSGVPDVPPVPPAAAEPSSQSPFDFAEDDELDPLPLAAVRSVPGPARTTAAAHAPASWTRPAAKLLPNAPQDTHQGPISPVRPPDTGYRNNPRPGQVSHGGRAKWLRLSAACSAAVGGGVYFFMQRQAADRANYADRQSQQLNDQIASQSRELAGLKQSFAEAEKANDKLSARATDAEKAAAAGPNLSAYVPKAQFEEVNAAKNDAQKKIDAQEKELSDLRAKATTTTAAAPPPSAGVVVLEPLPDPFQRLEGWQQWVFPIAEVEVPLTGSTNITIGTIQGSGGTQKCQLFLPLPLPKGTTNDSAYDQKTVTVFRPRALGIGNVPLCSFGAEKGQVFMQWPPAIPEDDAKRREILKYSMLKVKDDKGLTQIQFLMPDLVTFDPARQPSVGLPQDVIGREASLAFSPGSTWVSDGRLSARAASGKEVVRIYVQDGELRCTYNATLIDKSKVVGEKQDAWTASIAELQKKESETDPAKRDEAGLKQAKALFRHKTEEFAQAQEIINDLKNPKSFPDANALLLAGNGVVLCRIRVIFTR